MRYWALALLAFVASVHAQTRTITADSGQTVVVDITTVQDDNGDNVRTTSTIRTLGAVPNPIAGAPPGTGDEGPTYYWVTTTDADGNTVVNSYVFSPTFAPSSAPMQYTAGSVYDYSQWSAQYATRTVYPSGAAPLLTKNSIVGLGVTLGAAVGGMLLVFA